MSTTFNIFYFSICYLIFAALHLSDISYLAKNTNRRIKISLKNVIAFFMWPYSVFRIIKELNKPTLFDRVNRIYFSFFGMCFLVTLYPMFM